MKKLLLITASLFLLSCQSMLFYPQKELLYNPMHVKYRVKDYSVTTGDNKSLHAWSYQTARYFDNDSSHKGAVLFFHGNSNNVSGASLQFLWLLDYGYDIFMADYRGYGISEGKPTIENVMSDSLDIIDAFIELYPNEKNIVVLGQSLGGQPAAYVAANSQHADKIKLLILDSTFTSWKDVAKEVSSNFWLTWAFQSIIGAGFPDNISAKEYLPKTKAHDILIMHSRNDDLINYKNAEELYSLIDRSKRKELILIEKSPHAQLFNMPNNRKLLLDYINSSLK